MINIRSNMFETNSSSMHALCINTEELWKDPREDVYFQSWRKTHVPITIKCGYYGRAPQAPLTSFQEKIDYLWTAVVDAYYCFYPEFKEADHEKIEWWKEQLLQLAPLGSSFAEIESDKYWEFGIDHVANLYNFIDECEKEPRYIRALLDDESFIEVNGDEYPNFMFAFLPRIEDHLFDMPGRYSVYIKGC